MNRSKKPTPGSIRQYPNRSFTSRIRFMRPRSSTTVPLEVSNSSLHNDRGYLGMARGQDINSGSSQFYINTQNNRDLDGSYTVFGVVTSGMNVVDALASVPTYTNPNGLYYEQPVDPSQAELISITILSGG